MSTVSRKQLFSFAMRFLSVLLIVFLVSRLAVTCNRFSEATSVVANDIPRDAGSSILETLERGNAQNMRPVKFSEEARNLLPNAAVGRYKCAHEQLFSEKCHAGSGLPLDDDASCTLQNPTER